jgi:hypothetical protein
VRPVSPIVGADLASVANKVNELARASQDVTEEVADPFKITNLTKQYTLDPAPRPCRTWRAFSQRSSTT